MTFNDRRLAYLAGYRERRALRRNTAAVSGRALRHPIVSFSIVGAICTVAFAVLYNLFRSFANPTGANLLALGLTMVINFAANRRFTFQARSGSLPGQVVRYALVYVVGLVASTLVLDLGLEVVARPGRIVETLIALASGAVATVIRFLLLRAWVFRPIPELGAPVPVLATADAELSRDS
jgi:putative flippase GtrA